MIDDRSKAELTHYLGKFPECKECGVAEKDTLKFYHMRVNSWKEGLARAIGKMQCDKTDLLKLLNEFPTCDSDEIEDLRTFLSNARRWKTEFEVFLK